MSDIITKDDCERLFNNLRTKAIADSYAVTFYGGINEGESVVLVEIHTDKLISHGYGRTTRAHLCKNYDAREFLDKYNRTQTRREHPKAECVNGAILNTMKDKIYKAMIRAIRVEAVKALELGELK